MKMLEAVGRGDSWPKKDRITWTEEDARTPETNALRDWIALLAAALEPFSKLENCDHVRDLLTRARREGVLR